MQQSHAQPGTGANLGHPFIELLPITGVGISVFNRGAQFSTIYASDQTAARLQELQFDLGEGPSFSAFISVQPVFIPNVSEMSSDLWPMFASAVEGMRARAIFDFPLVMGAACVGVAELHRTAAGALSHRNVSTGMALARSIAAPALRRAAAFARNSPGAFEGAKQSEAPMVELRREVHQATGMVLAQLGIDATAAFARLRAHAFVADRSVSDVAKSVIARQLDFSALPD